MNTKSLLASIAACSLISAASAQQLLVCESTSDTVMAFSPADGSLLNASFIDLTTAGGIISAGTPIEVAQLPNGNFVISDQIADELFLWSADGTTYLGETALGFDNMRGLEVAYGSVWVSNSGTANSAFDDSVVQLDLNLNLVAVHALATEDPFDCTAFTLGGVAGLLLTDISGDDLTFFDPANPGLPTIFHDSDGATGIDFPEQCSINGANGNPVVANFTDPDGLREFDKLTGAELSFVDTGALGFGGLRGIHTLGNGNIMFTNGSGVHIYDVVAGTVSTVMPGVSARFISLVSGGTDPNVSTFCDPGNANSTGSSAVLAGTTGTGIGSGLHLEVTSGVPGQLAYMLVGNEATAGIAVSNGQFCLVGTSTAQFFRYNVAGTDMNSIGGFDASGTMINASGTSTTGFGFDVPTTIPDSVPIAIMAGDTWHFQTWYRDTPAGAGTSNFSNGLSVIF
ncbi:MAG: hypothetical protein P1V35_03490 [Planctomycetota bacterium]|nr:hypothetical protein [Planctomycetota bacterium]